MPKPFRFLAPILLFLFFTSAAFGQAVLLYQKNGATNDALGGSVAGAGDVDGDGKADFIIGADGADPGGLFRAGSAYVYSGADGTLLFQKNGAATRDRLGSSVAGAGDVNGDGTPDFIIGAEHVSLTSNIDGGSAYVYSGADGSLLYQKDSTTVDLVGVSVDGAGDVNGDGKADFIIGTPYVSPGGLVQAGTAYVFSGADGSLLYQKDGAAIQNLQGISVAGCGDVNGDGRADFIVGAIDADPGGLTSAGSAYVFSGADGSLLYQKDGAAAGDGLGNPVAGAGDVNGDGKADFIVSATGADPGGLTAAGSTYVYSGGDGSLLYQKDGSTNFDFLGNSVAGAGDVNGDEKADFLVGAESASPGGLFAAGSAYLYSGANGALLYQKDGATVGDLLGNSVAGAGDVNGGGKADFIIGAYGASPGGLSGAGSAYVYSYCVADKGDMNADAALTATDVMLMLDCVFLGTGSCEFCFADVNCDGNLAPADVVLELNAVFLASSFPC